MNDIPKVIPAPQVPHDTSNWIAKSDHLGTYVATHFPVLVIICAIIIVGALESEATRFNWSERGLTFRILTAEERQSRKIDKTYRKHERRIHRNHLRRQK